MNRRSVIVLVLAILWSVGLGNTGISFVPRTGHEQTSFTYCFNETMNVRPVRKDRFRDGILGWKNRESLSTTETTCANSAALTVSQGTIDGEGGTVAFTDYHNLSGNPVGIEFDNAEWWWESQAEPDVCFYVDWWAAAAHEIGHVWGLSHDHTLPPEYEPNTMTYLTSYAACPNVDTRQRDLSSNDEAGIHYIKNRTYMPNYGFERTQDCSSIVRCTPAFYWTMTNGNWARVCSGGAYAGNCYERILGIGAMYMKVDRALCNGVLGCTGVLTFYNRNPSSLSARVRVKVQNFSTGQMLLDSTCIVPALSAWAPCTKYFNGPSTMTRYYFAIGNETTGSEVRLDNVTVADQVS